MIDLHAHLLPGLDDGVRSVEEARAVAQAAVADGVTAIVATPHVREDYPTRADAMERGVAALRRDFSEAGIALDVQGGGEVSFERLWQLDDDELRRFTLGQGGRHILVEFPYGGWQRLLEETIASLAARGIGVVLAHPERNGDVQAAPERLEGAVAAGALVQITSASVTGALGERPLAAAWRLLELGLAHVLASDLHGPHVPRGSLADGAAALRDEALARRLTLEVPQALLAGEI